MWVTVSSFPTFSGPPWLVNAVNSVNAVLGSPWGPFNAVFAGDSNLVRSGEGKAKHGEAAWPTWPMTCNPFSSAPNFPKFALLRLCLLCLLLAFVLSFAAAAAGDGGRSPLHFAGAFGPALFMRPFWRLYSFWPPVGPSRYRRPLASVVQCLYLPSACY